MAYSLLDDLQKKIEPQKLIQLTDVSNNPPSAVDAAMITRAVQDADALIDSYMSTRYQTPFSPVPAAVRNVSATIAIYHLYLFRALDPDVWRSRYEDAVDWLKKISSGEIHLQDVAVTSSPTSPPNVTNPADERIFSRDTLKDF